MDNIKIIDGKEYHQIPVGKVYIDGIEFSNIFTTEELLSAKKIEASHVKPLPPTVVSSTPLINSSSVSSNTSSVSVKSKNYITLNKNLFIISTLFLIGTIITLTILLL